MPPSQQTELDRFKAYQAALKRGEISLVQTAPQAPLGTEEEQGPTIGSRIGGRFTGSDLPEGDPQEISRVGSTIAAGTAGFAAGRLGAGVVAEAMDPAASRAQRFRMGRPVAAGRGGVAGLFAGAAGGSAAAAGGSLFPEATLDAFRFFGVEIPQERGLTLAQRKEIAKGEALLEAATFGLNVGARLFGRAVSRGATGLNAVSDAVVQKWREFGVRLPPTKAGSGVVGRASARIFSGFPFLSELFQEGARTVGDEVSQAFRSLPFRIGPPMPVSQRGGRMMLRARAYFLGTKKYFNREYEKLFSDAEAAEVVILPSMSRATAVAMSRDLLSAGVQVADEGAPLVRETTENVLAFLEKKILRVDGFQSLRQMDEFIAVIDDFVANLEPQQQKFAASLLGVVKDAAKLDIRQGLKNVAPELSRRFEELDQQFFAAMEVFETATARSFEAVTRRGISGMVAPSRRATRQETAALAKVLPNLENTDAVDNLAALMRVDTPSGAAIWRRLTGGVVADALENSWTRRAISALDDEITFDPGRFRRELGLDTGIEKGMVEFGELAQRRDAVTRALEIAGKGQKAPLALSDLDDFARMLEVAGQKTEQGLVTFIARRVTLGGARAGITAFFPISGGRGSGPIRTLVGGVMALLPIRSYAKALIDPQNAIALRRMIAEDTPRIARREAVLRIVRGTMDVIVETTGSPIPDDLKREVVLAAGALAEEAEKMIEKFGSDGQQ